MPDQRVYMDNHATTQVDPRVLDVMRPFFLSEYGNAGSINHSFGDEAREAVENARQTIAQVIGASAKEICFTSGATESNNLAIKGIATSRRRRGDHILSVQTEHRAMLDPLARLAKNNFEVTLLPVAPFDTPIAGQVDLAQFESALKSETCVASVMLANNEIGVIQPLAAIGKLCADSGIPLHSDATQAVGKIPVDVNELGVDLMSFTAHKMYGPKGIGALYVRRGSKRIRLEPMIEGGGQENGLRSGTLNVPGIVGFAEAIRLSHEEMVAEATRLSHLRQRLFDGLKNGVEGALLNGPQWEGTEHRLPGNLNCRFEGVDGESLMLRLNGLAVSSGSACTSTDPEPSHVLAALGLNDDEVRSSLRFGLGRFNEDTDVDFAIEQVTRAVSELRRLG